jgi:hypothetical protein
MKTSRFLIAPSSELSGQTGRNALPRVRANQQVRPATFMEAFGFFLKCIETMNPTEWAASRQRLGVRRPSGAFGGCRKKAAEGCRSPKPGGPFPPHREYQPDRWANALWKENDAALFTHHASRITHP